MSINVDKLAIAVMENLEIYLTNTQEGVDAAVLETAKPMILHADGEYLGQFTKIKYECLPGMLKIIN